jgi:hypothetical protein
LTRLIFRGLVCAVAVHVLLVGVAEPSGAIPKGRYAIGDSVMLGASEELRDRGFHVNASRSRQFPDGITVVRSLKRNGRLPRKVVVHLGNNGFVYRGACGDLVRAAGSRRRVFLVTVKVPRVWRKANNRRLRVCAGHYENASLIDWYRFSKGHPGWFYDDGFHLNGRGRARYSGLIAHKVG